MNASWQVVVYEGDKRTETGILTERVFAEKSAIRLALKEKDPNVFYTAEEKVDANGGISSASPTGRAVRLF